ncbi:MAG: hypothetical protein ABJC74_17910 [Gemmatimonadota bacterium]
MVIVPKYPDGLPDPDAQRRITGRSRLARLLATLALLAGFSPVASAQRQANPGSGFTFAGSFDQWIAPGTDGGRVPTISLRLGGFDPDGPGEEFTLGLSATSPAGFAIADFSLTRGIPADDFILLLRGGLSLVVGSGVIPGAHLGLGVILPVIPRLGFRFDAVYRPLLIESHRYDTVSVGIGLMALPALGLLDPEPDPCQ